MLDIFRQYAHSFLIGRPLPFFKIVASSLLEHSVWVLVSPLIFVAATWIRSHHHERVSQWLALHVTWSFAVCAIASAIFHVLHFLDAHIRTSYVDEYLRGIYGNMWMYWTILVLYYVVVYYREFETSRVREAELRASLTQAELLNLRAQLRPHFLFNTLNTIASLVSEQPRQAEDLISDLSVLLRESINREATQIVPLAQEVELLKRYLAIQAVRFGDRLQMELNIEPSAERCLVPHLLLQPIAENAFQYGLSKRIAGGLLRVNATTDDSALRITVEDNGPGLDGRDLREGVGLSNTRERLLRLFGAGSSLEIHSASSGFSVEMRIPQGRPVARAHA